MIVSHLNVNSLSRKFDEVSTMIVCSGFEVVALSETKLDSSFQTSLYEIEKYVMYRQDKRSNSGGILIYVSKNIPSTCIPIRKNTENIECLSIELNCNGHKILTVCMYKNPRMSPSDFKSYFEELCETMFNKYEHVIIIGDLNFNMLQNNVLSTICPVYNLTDIIDNPTCFKSNQPTLIDVMLVTKRRRFMKGFSIDTGISDFHNLIGGVLRQHPPVPPKKL